MGSIRIDTFVFFLVSILWAGTSPATTADFFEQKIRPVLVERCFTCHSTAASVVKGGLLLDSAEALARGGESGRPALVPGDPGASLLMEALRYENEALQMPPKEPLPAPVVADFARWIREGAVFPASTAPIDLFEAARDHWAFHPPVPQALPAVRDTAWPRTDVDYFVLAKLEAAGLSPSPEADRRTLIRRLSFDLLGLPPAPADVDAFVADPDPEAYGQLVERYLASPHYGERWARHWLDVARYADTKGYVYGGREEVRFTSSYVYRDWVVDALNRDRPYDEFIKLQLAADKLTGESARADLAAMGFLTLGQRFLGVMPDIVDDRIDTVTRGLMGLTVSCARCHDHKFDPVPIEDYYSLYGVFSGSSERRVPIDPAYGDDPAYGAFTEEMKKREQALQDRFREESEKLETRLRGQVDRYLAAVPEANSLPTDEFYEIRNAEDLNPTIVRRWATFIEQKGPDDPIFGPWNRLRELPEADFPIQAKTVVTGLLTGPGNAPEFNSAVVARLGTMSVHSDLNRFARNYGHLFKQVNDRWGELIEEAEAKGEPAPASFPDPDWEAVRMVMMGLDSPIRVPDGAIVDLEWMFDESARVELGKLNKQIDAWIIDAETAPPFVVTLVDKPEMTPPRVFGRGNPANPGPQVPRQFLALLEGDTRKPFADGSGRREMAEAIARPDNPLTARVFVNRVWGWHFGAGARHHAERFRDPLHRPEPSRAVGLACGLLHQRGMVAQAIAPADGAVRGLPPVQRHARRRPARGKRAGGRPGKPAALALQPVPPGFRIPARRAAGGLRRTRPRHGRTARGIDPGALPGAALHLRPGGPAIPPAGLPHVRLSEPGHAQPGAAGHDRAAAGPVSDEQPLRTGPGQGLRGPRRGSGPGARPRAGGLVPPAGLPARGHAGTGPALTGFRGKRHHAAGATQARTVGLVLRLRENSMRPPGRWPPSGSSPTSPARPTRAAPPGPTRAWAGCRSRRTAAIRATTWITPSRGGGPRRQPGPTPLPAASSTSAPRATVSCAAY